MRVDRKRTILGAAVVVVMVALLILTMLCSKAEGEAFMPEVLLEPRNIRREVAIAIELARLCIHLFKLPDPTPRHLGARYSEPILQHKPKMKTDTSAITTSALTLVFRPERRL